MDHKRIAWGEGEVCVEPTRKTDLQFNILLALYRRVEGQSWTSWLRFLAKSEAQRLGGTEGDADEALKRLHELGYLALAFGYERGSLTGRGLWLAEQMARRARERRHARPAVLRHGVRVAG